MIYTSSGLLIDCWAFKYRSAIFFIFFIFLQFSFWQQWVPHLYFFIISVSSSIRSWDKFICPELSNSASDLFLRLFEVTADLLLKIVLKLELPIILFWKTLALFSESSAVEAKKYKVVSVSNLYKISFSLRYLQLKVLLICSWKCHLSIYGKL